MAETPAPAVEIPVAQWPLEPGPYLFLLEATGSFERRRLEAWIEANRPDDVAPRDAQIALLPQNRRRRHRRPDPRLEAFLLAEGDPLLVPMRVVWLAEERDGRRAVGLNDLLIPGDPRDPNALRQRLIAQTDPERMVIMVGATARRSAVRRNWLASEEDEAAGRSLVEYVALRAWLALERGERRLRGSRYKVPKFPRESLIEQASFGKAIAEFSQQAGIPYQQMALKMRYYVREIAATHSPYVIDLVTGAINWLFDKAYVGLHYDKEELEALYALSQQYPLVFLPSHKSNFDHLVLHFVLYQNGLPANHTAGGINMNFFPVGPFLRRSGVFFIRREFKDNEPYKFVLRRYLDYLLERRFPMEWFVEGGRSRSGKLRAPRLGLLAYVVESFQRGSADDVIIIPVALAYDQIQDVGSYAAEASGGKKESESFGWLLRNIRSVQRRYGSAHVRFGAPISLRTYLAEHDVAADAVHDQRNPAIPKLAFEVANRINEVTPITPISLVTLALLADPDRSLTVEETMDRLGPYLDIVARRDLPVTERLDISNRADVKDALDELVLHGVVSRHDGATETVYRISENQHLAAAYYRNTIIHFFITPAIAELALVAAADAGTVDHAGTVIAESLAIRDLLKFEFFFVPSDEFVDQIRFELADHDPEWRNHLASGEVHKVLEAFRPFQAPAVVRPFIDAMRVVADLIEAEAFHGAIDADQLRKDALALGNQYLLQGKIASAESVSKVLFDSAIDLAKNRGLLDLAPDMVDQRKAFARQLTDLVTRFERL